MGLSFLGKKDRRGAAIYLLHDGSGPQERELERLKDRLERLDLKHQILVLSSLDGDGEELRDFYDLQQLPAAMIARENDELIDSWKSNLPPPETIAYHARQVSS